LIREQFDIRNHTAIRKPAMTKPDTLAFKLADLARRCGIRSKEKMIMEEGQRFHGSSKRKEVPIAHGFRKFFMTQCVNSKVDPQAREMLLGHKIGLASCYYRPTEDEMYREYQKSVNNLTISEENRLKVKVEELAERQDEISYIKFKYENELKDLRRDMEIKFNQIFEKVDVARLS
jgi:hypothetical protein